jgi:hypothetical protein
MAMKIKAGGFLSSTFLKITDKGVVYSEATAFMTTRRFNFGQIDLILMSPTNELSFQVGQELFKIKTKPKHGRAIQLLCDSVAGAETQSVGFEVIRTAQVAPRQ